MRLQKYINEITELTDEEIDEMVEDGMKRYRKKIAKSRFKFWPTILYSLDVAFLEKFNIRFIANFAMTRQYNKYVNAVTAMKGDNPGFIKIRVKRKHIKDLKKGGKNFEKYLKKTLSHELIHRKQIEKVPSFVFKKSSINMTADEYYNDPMEIEAYAREATWEIINREKAKILGSFWEMKDEYPKVWRKFLKKFALYMAGHEDDLKEILKNTTKLNKEWNVINKEIDKAFEND